MNISKTYTTHLADIMDTYLDGDAKKMINRSNHNSIREEYEDIQRLSPYYVNPHAAHTLQSFGIPTNPYTVKLHSHAASKTIENKMLQHVGHIIKNQPITFIQFKRSKLQYMNRGDSWNDQFLNYHMEPKDAIRFENNSEFQNLNINNETAFLHDTLHHLEHHELYRLFQNNKKMKLLIATVVLPVECRRRLPSIYPELYNIEYPDGDENHFIYIPDGYHGGSYTHHINSLKWLDVNKLISHKHDMVITAEKIESYGAHHIFIFQRIDYDITGDYYTYNKNELVTLPCVFYDSTAHTDFPFSLKLVNRLILYSRSVKEITVRDAWAKIRQCLPTDELNNINPSHITILINYVLALTAIHSINDDGLIICDSLITRVLTRICNIILIPINFLFSAQQYKKLLKYMELKPFSMTVKKRNYIIDNVEDFRFEIDDEYADIEPPTLDFRGDHAVEESCSSYDVVDTNFTESSTTPSDDTCDGHDSQSTEPAACDRPETRASNTALAHIGPCHIEVLDPTEIATLDCVNYCGYDLKLPKNVNKKLDLASLPGLFDSSMIKLVTETIHDDISILVDEARSKLDGIPTSILDRARANIHRKKTMVTNASHKLTDLLVMTGWHKHHTQNDLHHLDICAAPGAFINTMHELFQNNYYLTTCSLMTGIPYDQRFLPPRERVTFVLGKNANGDITDFDNMQSICQMINETDNNYNLITADGGKLQIGRENEQEFDHTRLIMSELAVIMATCDEKSDIYVKFFDVYSHVSMQLIYLCTMAFEDVSIIKPPHSRPANSERYLHLRGATTNIDSIAHHLFVILHKIPSDDDIAINSVMLIDPCVIKTDETFMESYNRVVRNHARQQIAALNTLLLESNKLMKSSAADRNDIVIAHGFTTEQIESQPYSTPIIMNDVVAQINACCGDLALKPYIDVMLGINRNPYKYTIDLQRARTFVDASLRGDMGKLLSGNVVLQRTQYITRQLTIIVIYGAAGAGKSRTLQKHIRETYDKNVHIVTPTRNLVRDWRIKINGADKNGSIPILTYERAYLQTSTTPIVVFDDITKLPHGYIDAYLNRHVRTELAIIIGDPKQSLYHNENHIINTIMHDVDHFNPYCDYYINCTHRLPKIIARALGIVTSSSREGTIRVQTLPSHAFINLVPSTARAKLHSTEQQTAYTYTSCQGLTLKNVAMHIDMDTSLVEPRAIYTALSRVTGELELINTFAKSSDFDEKISSQPYLKTLLTLVYETEEDKAAAIPTPVPPCKPAIPKIHLPVENVNGMYDDYIERCADPDIREIYTEKYGKTQTIIQDHDRMQLIPRHRRNDDALYEVTLKKRILTESPRKNLMDLKRTRVAGSLLFIAYAKAMNVPTKPVPFDPDLWSQSRAYVERNYLSKTRTQLQTSTTRQDPDYEDNFISLFLKSQDVKKLEKYGKKIGPGQTVSSFKQEIILITATYAIYLRRKREETQPANIYIHSEKTLEEFDTFIKKHWNHDGPSYTSDYTAYDQSQNAEFLNFEIMKAKHYNIPEAVINLYTAIKTNAQTHRGNLKIMRLSGEGPTFDANTECNIAYDSLRYVIPKSSARCYAGDDLARDTPAPENPAWAEYQSSFSLLAKPEVTNEPIFCGMQITRIGVMRNPEKLSIAIDNAISTNKLPDVILSYSYDFQSAYRHGEALNDVLSERQLMFHGKNTRFFVKHGVHPLFANDILPAYCVPDDRYLDRDRPILKSKILEEASGGQYDTYGERIPIKIKQESVITKIVRKLKLK